MIKPTLEEFQSAAVKDRIVPLRRRIPADLETPVSAFLKLSTNLPEGQRARFLLESVEQGIQVGRYSFIGVAPAATISLVGDTVTIDRGGETTTVALEGECTYGRRCQPSVPSRRAIRLRNNQRNLMLPHQLHQCG